MKIGSIELLEAIHNELREEIPHLLKFLERIHRDEYVEVKEFLIRKLSQKIFNKIGCFKDRDDNFIWGDDAVSYIISCFINSLQFS